VRYNIAMQTSDDALDEFIAIYRKEFEEDIDRAEAGEMASQLLRLYELLARKLPNEKISNPKPRDESDETHPPVGFRT
jgi:flagellin-specific chaperone FliS